MSVVTVIGLVVSAGLILATFTMVIRLRNVPQQPIGYVPPSVEPEWDFKRKVHATIVGLLFAAFFALFIYSQYWMNKLYSVALHPNPSLGRVYPRALIGTTVVYLTHGESVYFSWEWYILAALGLSAGLLNFYWKALPTPSGRVPKRLY
jgi:hypothetical protein